jgi:hypothetical protein
MRFGKQWDQYKEENQDTGESLDFLRNLKKGDTEVVILTEPKDWIGYLEHFNPITGKYSFPCTLTDDCPGCNSEFDQMRNRSRKVAVPCLVDDKWVNVYRIPKSLAEKLERRAERRVPPTIRDRSYILMRDGDGLETQYDCEAGEKIFPDDYEKYEIPDIEEMLKSMYTDAWGELPRGISESVPAKVKPEDSYDEADLRATTPRELKKLIRAQFPAGFELPDDVAESTDSNEIVDWMLENLPSF